MPSLHHLERWSIRCWTTCKIQYLYSLSIYCDNPVSRSTIISNYLICLHRKLLRQNNTHTVFIVYRINIDKFSFNINLLDNWIFSHTLLWDTLSKRTPDGHFICIRLKAIKYSLYLYLFKSKLIVVFHTYTSNLKVCHKFTLIEPLIHSPLILW